MFSWNKLARKYGDLGLLGASPYYERQAIYGSVGWMDYAGLVWLQLFRDYFRIGIMFPFNFLFPTMRIPRAAVVNLKYAEYHLFGVKRRCKVYVDGVSICVTGEAALCLKDWGAGIETWEVKA